MDVDDQQPVRDPGGTAGGRTWAPKRKRIVAREVVPGDAAAAEVRDENHRASVAPLSPAELIDAAPPPPRAIETVLDPTELGERHRRAKANLVYRCAQSSIGLSFVTAIIGIAFTFFDDDHLTGQVLAGLACATAVAGVFLVRSSRLAYRLRGYAAAAAVLAVVAAAISLFLPNALGDEPKGAVAPTNLRGN